MINSPPYEADISSIGAKGGKLSSSWLRWFNPAQVILQAVQRYGVLGYVSPASGDVVAIGDGFGGTTLDPATPLAALTVTLPPNPVEGQQAQFSTSQAIAALTINASFPVVGAPTSLAAGTGVNMVFNKAKGTWFTAFAPGVTAAAPPSGSTTGLPTATQQGGILYYIANGILASSALLVANALVLGGGAGGAPSTPVGLGTTTTVLHGNVAGAPAWGSVVLTTDVSGTLPAVNGGTGLASYSIGDMLYAATTTTLAKISDVTAGSYLRSGGVATAPLWSTLVLPNAATTGDVIVATSTNTLGSVADVATGNVLLSGGIGAIPSFGKVNLASAVTGNLPVTNQNGGTLASSATFWRGDATWATALTGGLQIAPLSGNSGIEIGGLGYANLPYVDFHSGTTGANDYDSRIIATGGSTSAGLGSLSIMGAAIGINGVPVQPFDVFVNQGTFSATGNASMRLVNSSTTGQTPLDFITNSVLRARIRVDSTGNMAHVTNGGDHDWFVGGDSGVGTFAMKLNAAGNLGVGIAPNAIFKLDVAGPLRSQGTGAAASGTELDYVSGTGYVTSFNRAGGAYTPLNIRGSTVLISTGATAVGRILVDASGNVGINNAATTGYMLDVAGNGRFYGANTFSTTVTSASLGVSGSVPQVLHSISAAVTDQKHWDNIIDGGTMYWRAINDAVTAANIWMKVDRVGAVPTRITWGTNGQTQTFAIDVGQNVTIGNASFSGNAALNSIFFTNGNHPTTLPIGGGSLCVQAGALRYKGSSGSVTVIAPA